MRIVPGENSNQSSAKNIQNNPATMLLPNNNIKQEQSTLVKVENSTNVEKKYRNDAFLEVAGIKIGGIDVNKINNAEIAFSLPLNSGTYKIPAPYKDAMAHVPSGASMAANISISKNAHNKPIISKANIKFNKPLTVSNPATAFKEPTGGHWGWLADLVRDWVSKVVIDGMHLNDEGKFIVDGTLNKSCFGQDDLKDVVDLASPIPRSLEQLLPSSIKQSSIASPSNIQITSTDNNSNARTNNYLSANIDNEKANDSSSSSSIAKLLALAGAITSKGTFDIDMHADPSILSIDGHGAKLWTEEKAMQMLLHGNVQINDRGCIICDIDKNNSNISSQLGDINIGGKIRLTDYLGPHINISSNVFLDSKINTVHGIYQPNQNIYLPVEISGGDDHISMHAKAHINDSGKVVIEDGSSVNFQLHSQVKNDHVKINDMDVQFNEAVISSEGAVDFSLANDNQFKFNSEHISASIVGGKADFDFAGLASQIDGKVKAKIKANNLSYDSTTGHATGHGRLGYKMTLPKHLVKQYPELKSLSRIVNFNISEDGNIAFMKAKNSINQLLPMMNLSGNTHKAKPLNINPVENIGSAEFKDLVTQITGAPLRKNNEVQLLIDGIMSFPKRLEMINNAKNTICLQTLIFKDDESGMQIADALVKAAQRGVDVYVIVDSMGNMEGLDDLTNTHPVYDKLQNGGVNLRLYNCAAETGLRQIIQILKENPELTEIKDFNDLQNPAITMKFLNELSAIACNKSTKNSTPQQREKIKIALGQILTSDKDAPKLAAKHLLEMTADGVVDTTELLTTVKRVADLNHRWHEKYLIVDNGSDPSNKEVILGGLNIADEYLFGGTNRRATSMGVERIAWRDTDVYVKGQAACDALQSFADNWQFISGESPFNKSLAHNLDNPERSNNKGTEVQVVQHRPKVDGDHNITNVLIEGLKCLKPGQRAYFANAYFITTGALEPLKEAMMDAVKRGVDVRVLTNSKDTTDAPQLNQAAVYPYRELLEAGVRIFERKGEQTMHQKVAILENVAKIGSWNMDNRSASLNSEGVAFIYGEEFAGQMYDMLEQDMASDVATEVMLEDVQYLPISEEVQCMALSTLSDLM